MSLVSFDVGKNNPVTVEDLRNSVGKFNVEIKHEEEDDYLQALKAMHESVQVLLEADDYYPIPDRDRFPRLDLHYPNPEENTLGAWAWKYTLRDSKTDSVRTGLLAGRTVCLKDCIGVADVPCLLGTDVIRDWTPRSDATVVTRLLEAGATIVGQAVCENMAMFAASFSAATGPVHNPYAKGRSAGGSSSGCAALVAAGLCDLAVGADQGGSIRMPSALCGLVGMKPTFGLVPYTGIYSVEATNDHAGPMTRTVLDNALMLQVLAGADGLDDRQGAGCPFPVDVPPYAARILSTRGQPLTTLRFGLLREGLDMPGVDPRVRACVVDAALKFRELGATVDEICIPLHKDGPAYHLAAGRMAAYVGRMGMASSRRQVYMTDLTEKFLPWTQEKWDKMFPSMSNAMINGAYCWDKWPSLYGKTQNLLRKVKDAYEEKFKQYDIIILPTVPQVAGTLGHESDPPKIKLAKTMGQSLASLSSSLVVSEPYSRRSPQNCAIFNQVCFPAMSLPIAMLPPTEGPHDCRLPVAFQLVGRQWAEETLYRAALAWEDNWSWKERGL